MDDKPEAAKEKLQWQGASQARPAVGGGLALGTALKALVAIAVILGVLYVTVPQVFDPIFHPGGPVRNCIKRVFGDLPECSDQDGGDGTLKRTTLNGVDLGLCRRLSNEGCIAR